jgi:predicted DCC family thiol-disulfide oxidoreductase YuxK
LPNDLSTSVLLRYHISDDFLHLNDRNLHDKNKVYYTNDIDTELSLLPQPELLMKSDASLELVKYLDYPWPIAYIFKIFPKSFRDGIYDWWARNRYQNFGKTDSCQAPIPGNYYYCFIYLWLLNIFICLK